MARDLNPPPVPGVVKRSNRVLWILGVVTLLMLIAGAFGAITLWDWFSSGDLLANDIPGALAEHPAAIAALGEIEEVTIDWIGSGEHDDEDTFVFDVIAEHTNASLTAELHANNFGDFEITSGELELEDGTVLLLGDAAEQSP